MTRENERINMFMRLRGLFGLESPKGPSGLRLWLAADHLSLNDGDSVDVWPDSSRHNDDATRTAGASGQPTYQSGVSNGLPVIRFAGTSGLLIQADFEETLTQGNTIFVVSSGLVGDAQYYFDGITDTDRHALIRSGTNMMMYAGFTPSADAGGFPRPMELHTCLFDGASSKLVRNGDETLIEQSAGNNDLTGLTVGNRYDGVGATDPALDGDIGEILVYDRALSDTERKHVETYLMKKWGL